MSGATRRAPSRTLLAAVVASLALPVVPVPGAAGWDGSRPGPGSDPAERLSRAFRSHLDDVRVELDHYPARNRVRGRAELDLTLREGQDRILFHFNPSRALGPRQERGLLRRVRLDGRSLDPGHLRLVRGIPGAETAFELPGELEPGSTHTLRVSWRAPASQGQPGWLFPRFDDTEGPRDETETMWPTISSPEALARHRVLLRVHGQRPYTVLGSGSVRRVRSGARADTWRVDTRRAVSSSNVFFAAVPRREVRSRQLTVRGVDVRIVSNRPPATVRTAARTVRRSVRDLVEELGPFPTPRVAVLLTGWGSGMEYYGAMRTGLGALRHELGHMYFGTTTVNRTWRDTWFDESAVVWWEARRRLRPVPRDFRSSLAVGRSVAAPGFDTRAYGAGARVLDRVARAFGGSAGMLAFLADLHRRRAFTPFTTDDLIEDITAAQDRIGRRDLERWLQGGGGR